MRTEGKYILGTADEIAEYVLRDVLKEKFIDSKSEFYDCDFAFAAEGDYDDLEETAFSSDGWYGIKKIDTGFYSEDLNLFADYYGGGCGVYNSLYDGLECKQCVEIVSNMIIGTINICESCNKDTLLIAEMSEMKQISCNR